MNRFQMVLLAGAEVFVVLVAVTVGGGFIWLRTHRPNTGQPLEIAKGQATTPSERLEQERKNIANTHVKAVLTRALESYHIDHENYPQRLDDLLRVEGGKGPYIENAQRLIDPWG